jgi:DeoR family transcriptional regulator, fructose operon transcriptional repressor
MSSTDTAFAEERRLKILDLLQEQKRVTVAELAAAFSVTPATVRTDLRDLDRSELLTRTHGGAIVRMRTGMELDSARREVQNLDEKRRVARAALATVQHNDTIVLDTGTTTIELARCLNQRRNIKVVTNDIEIARVLEGQEATEVILLGGLLRKGFHCTIRVDGLEPAAGLRVDKAFMAANSFSLERGAMTPDVHQADMKRQMMALANKVFVMVDHTKLGGASFAQFAPLDRIDALITDAIEDDYREKLEECGLEVILPPPGGPTTP